MESTTDLETSGERLLFIHRGLDDALLKEEENQEIKYFACVGRSAEMIYMM